MPDLRAVLLDIEGTTTPIAFVHDLLFPFARLPALLRDRAGDPVVAVELAAVPGHDKLRPCWAGWTGTPRRRP